MKNLTLNKLIEHLQNIQQTYGNMPVYGNIISDEDCYVSSLCVDTSEDEPQLLIEVEKSTDIPVFSTYDYPSMKELC